MLKNISFACFMFISGFMIFSCGQQDNSPDKSRNDGSSEITEKVPIETHYEALIELKNGNKRFLENKLINTNYKMQIDQTKTGQKPHSVILSCIDSRVPPEIIFDQGIGNIFVVRVAGNVEDMDAIGGMEYAVEHTGSKLIVVLGHSHCGAVTGAVKNIELGNLTQLLEQIKPAIKSDVNDPNTIDETARNNVKLTIEDIKGKSDIIHEMIKEDKISIVGAFYDIETGTVTFLE